MYVRFQVAYSYGDRQLLVAHGADSRTSVCLIFTVRDVQLCLLILLSRLECCELVFVQYVSIGT